MMHMKNAVLTTIIGLMLASAAVGCAGREESDGSATAAVTSADAIPATLSTTEAPAESADDPEIPVYEAGFRLCSMEDPDLGTLRYWLYVPANATDNMPLILYLHGGSGKGSDPELITDADGFPRYLRDGQLGDVRAFAVIPQLPADRHGWPDIRSSLLRLLDTVAETYGTDRGNVSLTGHSMGGTGTWNVALSCPGVFARIAPLSGSIRNTPENLRKFADIPIRAFVGSADTIVDPESTLTFIEALRAAGADATVTVFDGADHFSVPSLTYLDRNIDLVSWLTGAVKSTAEEGYHG